MVSFKQEVQLNIKMDYVEIWRITTVHSNYVSYSSKMREALIALCCPGDYFPLLFHSILPFFFFFFFFVWTKSWLQDYPFNVAAPFYFKVRTFIIVTVNGYLFVLFLCWSVVSYWCRMIQRPDGAVEINQPVLNYFPGYLWLVFSEKLLWQVFQLWLYSELNVKSSFLNDFFPNKIEPKLSLMY